MKVLYLLIFTFSINILIGQVKPNIFPEDLLSEDIEAKCYCSPGVYNKSRSKGIEISYGWMNGGTFNEQDHTFSNNLSRYNRLENLEFKLKIPVILKDNFKLLIGYKHFSEYFNFNEIGSDFDLIFKELDNQALKSNSISIIVSKPIDEKRYLAFRLKYTSNGDYNRLFAFEKKYSIYKFMGLYAFKPHEGLEWGFGLGGSISFRRNSFLPFILFNKNFNKHWGIESVLPGLIFGRYNINRSNIFLFGAEYNSESYRIDITEKSTNLPFAYAYNHAEVLTSIRLEHRFTPWLWGNIKAGYQFNFSSDFESKNEFPVGFNANPTGAPFFQIGVFISPPKIEDHHSIIKNEKL